MIWAWLLLFLSPMGPRQLQTPAVPKAPQLIDLAQTQGVRGINGGSEAVFVYTFTRQGQRRETLVVTAGSAFEMEISNSSGRTCMSLSAAMPFNLGDGAVLKLSIRDEAGGKQILELPLDPAHVRAHRQWLPIRVGAPAGLPLRFLLRLEVTAGVRGDYTADWVGVTGGDEPGCLFTSTAGSRKPEVD